MSDEISRCPAAMSIVPKLSYYSSELEQYRKLAAEEQYNAGLQKANLNTRLSWKDAYSNYLQADRFVPGYKDVNNRIAEAKFNATLKVVVEQIPVPRVYQLTSDFFLQQMIENLMRYRPNEFVAYYSPESADKAGIKNPDQLLKLSFDDFVIGQVYDKESVRDVRRDSVIVGTVTQTDGRRVNAYNTVRAKLTINHRELISRGVLDVTIVDLYRNTIVSQRKFPGEFVWFTEWGFFNGDERALNDKQRDICKHKPEQAPNPQDLFIEFTKPIFNQVTPFLKTFYKQY
jgi:hypothetical protein